MPRRSTAPPAPLPPVGPGDKPEKIYYKIGEVAKLLGLPQYVLRYWETEFQELQPRKTGSGRRIYTRADIELLKRLQHLLHEKRFTIAGARQVLAGKQADPSESGPSSSAVSPELRDRIGELRRDLEDLRALLSGRPPHRR